MSVVMTDAQNKFAYKEYFLRDAGLSYGSQVELYMDNGHVVEGNVHQVLWDLTGEFPIAVVMACPIEGPKTPEDLHSYVRTLLWDHIVEIRPRLKLR